MCDVGEPQWLCLKTDLLRGQNLFPQYQTYLLATSPCVLLRGEWGSLAHCSQWWVQHLVYRLPAAIHPQILHDRYAIKEVLLQFLWDAANTS